MGYDPFTLISIARINAVLVPAGPIKASRYNEFVKGIEEASVTASSIWPAGRIVYDFAPPRNAHHSVDSFPFELNREVQAVLAIADGTESLLRNKDGAFEAESPAFELLLADFDRHVSYGQVSAFHVLLVFDVASQTERSDVLFISSSKQGNEASLTTAMSDLSRRLSLHLAETTSSLEHQHIGSPRLAPRTRWRGGVQSVASGDNDLALRPTSQNRTSTFGISPASSTEAQISRANSRFQIVEGMMYLQTGQWTNALRELSEGAMAARGSGDYIWHANALQHILVCMLTCAAAGIRFEIPQICYPAEKGPALKPSQSTSNVGALQNGESDEHFDQTFDRLLLDLGPISESLISTILTLLSRAASFSEEKLPHLMMCETRVKLANLLIFLRSNRGVLDQPKLSQFVFQASTDDRSGFEKVGSLPSLHKRELAGMLLDAARDPQNEITNNEKVGILIRVASGLAGLGLERKQAFYLRDLLQELVPSLVEARKIGAAEMGIHPAAGLSMLNANASEAMNPKRGLKSFLEAVCSLYGVFMPYPPEENRGSGSIDAIRHGLDAWNFRQSTGAIALKLEILRLCINVCEALPDLAAGLHFTVQLLQASRQTVTISRSRISSPPMISVEEQMRLFHSIKRTLNAAPKLGLPYLRADYWDDFLVRDIRLLEDLSEGQLTQHTPAELVHVTKAAEAGSKDPFIFNPSAKPSTAISTAPVLVAGERASFAVTLQNTLEFEVELERISLLTEGTLFESETHSIVLAPFCTQNFILSGTPKMNGQLKVKGCCIQVRHCYERSFYLFRKDWQASTRVKVKRRDASTIPASSSPEHIFEASAIVPSVLQADELLVTVIEPQPNIFIVSENAAKPSFMLLEGETKRFTLTVRNESKSTPADLLLFAYEDSVSSKLRLALENRDLGPAEIYELQHQLATSPSLRRVEDETEKDAETGIASESIRAFVFEVVGKPGLTNATVLVEYAYLGMPRSDIREVFYTRRATFPVALTVNGSIEIPRFSILTFSDNFAWQRPPQDGVQGSSMIRRAYDKESKRGPAATEGLSHHDISLLPNVDIQGGSNGDFLALLDFRNVWPQPLLVNINTGTDAHEHSDGTKAVVARDDTSEVLQPGHVTRVVLVVPKVLVSDPHAPIPTIGNQRQFVVSNSKMSGEAEAAAREAFWYREEVLRRIHGTWMEEGTGRMGEIDFRGAVRLSPRMLDAIKVDDVDIEYYIRPVKPKPAGENSVDANIVKRISKTHFSLHIETFATLVVQVRNRTNEPLSLLLRLQPSLRNQPHNIALDLGKRFVWSGVLQQALRPLLQPGDVREAELGILALVAGDFEVKATVEEIQCRRAQPPSKVGEVLRPRPERRIWHAREPCWIDAVEAEEG